MTAPVTNFPASDQAQERARACRILWIYFGSLLGLFILLLGLALYKLRSMEKRADTVVFHGLNRVEMIRYMRKAARARVLLLVSIVNDDDQFERDDP